MERFPKLILIIVISFLAKCGINAQVDSNTTKYLLNDSLKYKILMVGPKFFDNEKKQVPMKYLVVISINEEEKIQYKKLNYDQWIECLKNSSTDWHTNLLLYSLYKKDAILLDKKREDWIKSKNYGRERDLKYWRKYLKDKNNLNFMFAPDSVKENW